ncbi:MAG: SRPBCC domain-containing protein [Ferruginibacter sp.]|nr:SRPBCC domain-containing protein [Ferruginibacter sp.]
MKDFKAYFIISAEPELVYQALTQPATIQLWTGEAAEMSAEPGSEFSLWSGSISGRNLEFIPGKVIKQQWYFGAQEAASIVTIKLHADKKGTSIEIRQTNIPDEDYDNITSGWKENYIGALQEFYNE